MTIKSNSAQQNDAWDSGELGRSMDHVGVVSDDDCRALDGSLGLHQAKRSNEANNDSDPFDSHPEVMVVGLSDMPASTAVHD